MPSSEKVLSLVSTGALYALSATAKRRYDYSILHKRWGSPYE